MEIVFTQTLDIKEIVSNRLTQREKVELVRYIMTADFEKQDFDKCLKELNELNDSFNELTELNNG